MLSVEPRRLARLVEEDLETLMHAHWRECSIDQAEVPFDPDWAMAYTMERCNILHCFGLYRHEHLVGYSVFEVSTHLHFKTTKFAYNSGAYITPEHRGFGGAFLVDSTDKLLREMGCKKIVYLVPSSSALGAVLKHIGYEPSESYFTKLVG